MPGNQCLPAERCFNGHALVMALYNASAGQPWGSGDAGTVRVMTPAQTIDIAKVSGYANTQAEIGMAAADAARNYRSGQNDVHTNDSGWFLPSAGQWVYSISDFARVNPKEEWIINASNDLWLDMGDFNKNNKLAYVLEGPSVPGFLTGFKKNR